MHSGKQYTVQYTSKGICDLKSAEGEVLYGVPREDVTAVSSDTGIGTDEPTQPALRQPAKVEEVAKKETEEAQRKRDLKQLQRDLTAALVSEDYARLAELQAQLKALKAAIVYITAHSCVM